MVGELVVPYIEGDAAFARFVSCTSRGLVPCPRLHWERRFASLLRALRAGTVWFAVRMNPEHDLFGELRGEAPLSGSLFGELSVIGTRVDQLVRQLREAGDRLNAHLHPAYVTLETGGAPGAIGRVGIEWRAQDY